MGVDNSGSQVLPGRITEQTAEEDENQGRDPRPIFSRSPRRYIPYPQNELELLPPPNIPTKPTVSLLSIFVPVIGVWVSVIVQIIASQSAGGTGRLPVYAFISVPLALITVIFGVWNFRKTRNKYKAELVKRKEVYRNYIQQSEEEIKAWEKDQTDAMIIPNPSLDDCIMRAEAGFELAKGFFSETQNDISSSTPSHTKKNFSRQSTVQLRLAEASASEKDQRLWEREPEHLDFLHLRLGTGDVERSFRIKPPPSPPLSLEEDDLIQEGINLEKNHRLVHDLPILLPLNSLGSVGIVGAKPDERLKLVQAVIMQLVTHHAPNNVKVVLVIPQADFKKWEWVRRLPHNWNDAQTVRFFVTGGSKKARQSRHAILSELEGFLNQRKMLDAENTPNENQGVHELSYVFIFADRNLWNGPSALQFGPLMDLLLEEGEKLGAYSIFIAGHRSQIPKDCKAVVHLEEVNTSGTQLVGTFEIVGPVPEIHVFKPDQAEPDQINRLVAALAPIHVEQLASQVPSQVTIQDVFSVDSISSLDISQLWKTSQPWVSLEIPIGKKTSGEGAAIINLQDASKPDGFGVHAMVGGTTGTGKTKFLQTLILLTCAYYSPIDVNFVLIDYKGGDLAKGLDGLPHIVGSLANVESQGRQSDLIQRLFTSFDVEIQRRKNILNGDDINAYMERYHLGRESRALPHLFIVIDEFTEMILRNPVDDPNKSLMKRLMSIAAIGRSIGLHLILATQNPGSIVTEDLRNNINTRICLRMGTREASKAILNRYDAFDNITKDQVGRAYIQVGNNDRFELVQVAWGGAKDFPQGEGLEGEIARVSLQGTRVRHKKQDDSSYDPQITVLARNIISCAKNNNLPEQTPVWLPMLPSIIPLSKIRHERGWNRAKWVAPQNYWLSPVVGKIDDPANRSQPELTIDFVKEGHLLVHGGPVSGKTTLIQTLLTSLILDHSPEDLHIYIIDYGVQALRVFEEFPHVGAVISGSETERVRRLFTFLKEQVDSRKKVLSGAAPSVEKLRQQNLEAALPDIFLVIDNFVAFMDGRQISPEFDILKIIANEGTSLGIHLILTTTSPNYPQAIREKISNVICLEMVNPVHYLDSIGRTGGLYPAADTPGRGIIRESHLVEFQTALINPDQSNDMEKISVTEQDRQLWLKALSTLMTDAAHKCLREQKLPVCIPPMPEKVDLRDLLRKDISKNCRLNVPIAIDNTSSTLQPLNVGFDMSSHFWVVGPPLSGRTTFLRNWILALSTRYNKSELKFVLFDFEESGLVELKDLPNTCHVFTEISDQINLKAIFEEEVFSDQLNIIPIDDGSSFGNESAPPATVTEFLVIIDDFGVAKSKLSDSQKLYLTELAKRKDSHIHFILAGSVDDLRTTGPLETLVRKSKSGFALAISDWSFTSQFSIMKPNIPEAMRMGIIGSGYYYVRGIPKSYILFPQDAVKQAGGVNLWLEQDCKS